MAAENIGKKSHSRGLAGLTGLARRVVLGKSSEVEVAAIAAEEATINSKVAKSTQPRKAAGTKSKAKRATETVTIKAEPKPSKTTVSKAEKAKPKPKLSAAKKSPAKQDNKPPVQKAATKKAVAQKVSTKKTGPSPERNSIKLTKVNSSVPEVTTKTKPSTSSKKLAVLATESAWTKTELADVTKQLEDHISQLSQDLVGVEGELADLIRSFGDGAGHDQADLGASSFERDQEMTIAHNTREMLLQSQHALSKLADGSYGICEVCSQPIGKGRLLVFPRATLCMSCKQMEERR